MNLTDLVADVEHRLSYHPNVTAEVAAAHESIRTILTNATKEALSVADSISPAAREVSLALTAIEEADHWLHAHIARNQPAATADVPVVPAPAVPAPAAASVTTIDPATGGTPVVPGSSSTAVIEVPATGLVVAGAAVADPPPPAVSAPAGSTQVVDGAGVAPAPTQVVDGSGIASVTNPAPAVPAPPTDAPAPPA